MSLHSRVSPDLARWVWQAELERARISGEFKRAGKFSCCLADLICGYVRVVTVALVKVPSLKDNMSWMGLFNLYNVIVEMEAGQIRRIIRGLGSRHEMGLYRFALAAAGYAYELIPVLLWSDSLQNVIPYWRHYGHHHMVYQMGRRCSPTDRISLLLLELDLPTQESPAGQVTWKMCYEEGQRSLKR